MYPIFIHQKEFGTKEKYRLPILDKDGNVVEFDYYEDISQCGYFLDDNEEYIFHEAGIEKYKIDEIDGLSFYFLDKNLYLIKDIEETIKVYNQLTQDEISQYIPLSTVFYRGNERLKQFACLEDEDISMVVEDRNSDNEYIIRDFVEIENEQISYKEFLGIEDGKKFIFIEKYLPSLTEGIEAPIGEEIEVKSFLKETKKKKVKEFILKYK